MKCVGFSGTLIDVNNEEHIADKNVGMSYFEESWQYNAVYLSSLFTPKKIGDRKVLDISNYVHLKTCITFSLNLNELCFKFYVVTLYFAFLYWFRY